jgi:hypothetical protein
MRGFKFAIFALGVVLTFARMIGRGGPCSSDGRRSVTFGAGLTGLD